MTSTAAARFLPHVMTRLAIGQLLLVRRMIEGHSAALGVEHHACGLLGKCRQQHADKQKGHQENRAARTDQQLQETRRANVHITAENRLTRERVSRMFAAVYGCSIAQSVLLHALLKALRLILNPASHLGLEGIEPGGELCIADRKHLHRQ